MQSDETKTISSQDENSIFCSASIHRKMKEILGEFQIPEWILKSSSDNGVRSCAYCDTQLSVESLRGINICLNAQHIGDIQVEVLCAHCNRSYFLQFRHACSSIEDFIHALMGVQPYGKPVLLSDIKPCENNIAAILIEEHQSKNTKQ